MELIIGFFLLLDLSHGHLAGPEILALLLDELGVGLLLVVRAEVDGLLLAVLGCNWWWHESVLARDTQVMVLRRELRLLPVVEVLDLLLLVEDLCLLLDEVARDCGPRVWNHVWLLLLWNRWLFRLG